MDRWKRHYRKHRVPEFETPGLDNGQAHNFPIPRHIAGDAGDRNRLEESVVRMRIVHFLRIKQQKLRSKAAKGHNGRSSHTKQPSKPTCRMRSSAHQETEDRTHGKSAAHDSESQTSRPTTATSNRRSHRPRNKKACPNGNRTRSDWGNAAKRTDETDRATASPR